MDGRPLALWVLLLMGTVLPQACSQHWSYGLSPGGKRELDSFSDTLGDMVEGNPHVDTLCRCFGLCRGVTFYQRFQKEGSSWQCD